MEEKPIYYAKGGIAMKKKSVDDTQWNIYVKIGKEWAIHTVIRCIIGGCLYTGTKSERRSYSLTEATSLVRLYAGNNISIVFERKI